MRDHLVSEIERGVHFQPQSLQFLLRLVLAWIYLVARDRSITHTYMFLATREPKAMS